MSDISEPDAGETVDALAAVARVQRQREQALRVPIGVIGPREASDAQLAIAREVGELLARCGLTVVCGGRGGIMQAVCEGVEREGGISIGMLPEPDPSLANPFVTIPIATGIGEARNALIARAAFCLICIGNSFGTLSEVALGRQFGKTVIGLAHAPDVAGVVHVGSAHEAVTLVANMVLGRR
ncbi:MAG TPA: lysine decarboxylase [Burkholderiales bacterium]|nr:lysine decarboxylase [Burkholderiales bacterium]